MAEGSLAQSFIDPDKDKPRKKSMARLRVVNRNTLQLALPGGNVVPPGEHEILVYEDEVAAVKAVVEPASRKLDVASEAFTAAILQEVKQQVDWEDTMEALQRAIDRGKDPHIVEVYARVLANTEESIEAQFYRLENRSVLPLVSAEVIETGIAEPQRQGMKAEQDNLVAVLERIFAPGGNAAQMEAIIAAKVEEQLEARIDAKLRQLGIIAADAKNETPKPATPRKQ